MPIRAFADVTRELAALAARLKPPQAEVLRHVVRMQNSVDANITAELDRLVASAERNDFRPAMVDASRRVRIPFEQVPHAGRRWIEVAAQEAAERLRTIPELEKISIERSTDWIDVVFSVGANHPVRQQIAERLASSVSDAERAARRAEFFADARATRPVVTAAMIQAQQVLLANAATYFNESKGGETLQVAWRLPKPASYYFPWAPTGKSPQSNRAFDPVAADLALAALVAELGQEGANIPSCKLLPGGEIDVELLQPVPYADEIRAFKAPPDALLDQAYVDEIAERLEAAFAAAVDTFVRDMVNRHPGRERIEARGDFPANRPLEIFAGAERARAAITAAGYSVKPVIQRFGGNTNVLLRQELPVHLED